nr:hypothetical protein [Burkholderia alba]
MWTYTFEQWSLEQAERYVGDLVEAFERLARGEWAGAAEPRAR